MPTIIFADWIRDRESSPSAHGSFHDRDWLHDPSGLGTIASFDDGYYHDNGNGAVSSCTDGKDCSRPHVVLLHDDPNSSRDRVPSNVDELLSIASREVLFGPGLSRVEQQDVVSLALILLDALDDEIDAHDELVIQHYKIIDDYAKLRECVHYVELELR